MGSNCNLVCKGHMLVDISFLTDKHGSPKKSVIVLEMKNGSPTYKDTIQPAEYSPRLPTRFIG